VHDGNSCLVDVAAGANPDVRWTIDSTVAFTVVFAPPDAGEVQRDSAPLVRCDLWNDAGVAVLRAYEEPQWIDARDAEFVEWAAPGRYRLVLDFGVGEPIEREFELRAGDDDARVDLR
jgi:hypothetical protein